MIPASSPTAPAPATGVAPPAGAPPTASPGAPVFTPPPAGPFTPAPVYPAPAYSAPGWRPPPAPTSPSATTAAQPPPEAPPPRRDSRETDAHADHVIWMPTGETHPKGTAYFSSYEILILQAGYAVTDTTQVTLTFVPIFTEDFSLPIDVTVKGVLARSRRVRLAATGAATGVAAFEDQPGLIGRAGAVAQLCFDDACRSSANVGANLLLLGSQMIVADAVGGIFRLSDLTAILAEVQSIVPFGRDVGRYNGVGAALGVRLSGSRWGVDLSVQVPLTSDDDVPEVIPVIAATYRTGP